MGQIKTVDDYVAVRDARVQIIDRLKRVDLEGDPDPKFGLQFPLAVWQIILGALQREQILARETPLRTLLGHPAADSTGEV